MSTIRTHDWALKQSKTAVVVVRPLAAGHLLRPCAPSCDAGIWIAACIAYNSALNMFAVVQLFMQGSIANCGALVVMVMNAAECLMAVWAAQVKLKSSI